MTGTERCRCVCVVLSSVGVCGTERRVRVCVVPATVAEADGVGPARPAADAR